MSAASLLLAAKLGGKGGARGPIDENALTAAMQQLGNKTRDVKMGKRLAKNRETISTLMEALRTKPKFTRMVEYSIECLKNLAVDDVSIEELMDEGVLSVLENVQKVNPYNEKIQVMISKTINAFATNERLAAIVGEKFGAKSLIFSLQKHVEPETISTSLTAITRMMQAPVNGEMFVKSGLIGTLKQVLKTQEENGEVIAAAAKCLDRLADNRSFAAELMESGVIAESMAALRHFPENAAIVQHNLSFLNKLAVSHSSVVGELKSLGVMDTLVTAIEHHPDNEAILQLGSMSMRYFAGENDLTSAFGVQVGNNAETAAALGKLASLLLVDENVDFLIQNQGIGWLVSAIQSSIGDQSETASKILASACRALMRLAADENKIYGIMQQGGVKLLVAVLQQHVTDESVADSALRTLTKMLTRKENAIYILKSGAFAACQAMMSKHPDSEKTAKAMLDFVGRLTCFEESVPALVQAGVIPMVVSVFNKFGNNAALVQAAIETLGKLGISSAIIEQIAKEGGVKAVVGVLGNANINGDLALTKAAILMLESAALVPSNTGVLRETGCADAILQIMELHKDDKDLQQLGKRTVGVIQGTDSVRSATAEVAKLVAVPASLSSAIAVDKLSQAIKAVANLSLIDENLQNLIDSGAVGKLIPAYAAVQGMANSDKKSGLLTSIAAGLLRLNKTPEVSSQIMSGGCVRGLLKNAAADSTNEELAQHVSELIAQLSCDGNVASSLSRDGGVAELIAIAKAFPLNEKILASVTRAIGQLVNTQGIAEARNAATSGGADVVIESMFANLENPALLNNALEVLNQLAVDEASGQALVNAGAIDAILEAIRVHYGNPEVLLLCFQSLCRILVSEQVAIDIGAKGGLPLAIKAMRDHYQVESLCEVLMILLDSLASINDNAEKLRDPELATVELVQWIGNAYQNNAPLNEAMQRLLASLIQDNRKGHAVSSGEQDFLFDESFCDQLIDRCRVAAHDKEGSAAALRAVVQSLQDPNNAKLFISRGGLQALADVINGAKDDENLFYAASAAFLALTENGGENLHQQLENPKAHAALCSMVNAHEIFETPMALGDLTKAIKATAKIKLKGNNVNSLLNNRPLDSLMQIMMQSDDPLLLSSSAKLLGKLSNNGEAALLLSKLANLRELIAAMRRNIENEDFLKYSVYLLGNLAVNDELKNQIGIEGGIQVILQVMDRYAMNEGLVENCCYALANLSFGSEVNVSFIVASKGIQLLLGAMSNHPRAEELLESAVCVLCNLCHKNDPNRDAIIKAGGAQAIVDTVLNNFNALELLLTAFRTLGNLAYNAAATTAIIKAGGVQGIVAGMTVHNETIDVIDISIRVLTNLASEPTEENMKIMAQEGAVQAIVEVAIGYTDKPEIEVAALGCLCNLGRQLDNANMIIKQGGAEACVKAMKKHENDLGLVANGIRLANVLSHTKPTELERIHEAGIVEAIVAGLKAHSQSRTVVSNGLMALTLLSYNGDAANKMGGLGVIQQVLRLAQDNAKSPQVLAECFPALSALSRSEANAVAMSELAMKAVLSAIQMHNNDVKFLCFAFSFLSNLCVHSDATVAILQCPVVMAALDTLVRHTGEIQLLLRGLRALENMCFSTRDVKDHLKACEIEAQATKISEQNSTSDDVKKACKSLIDALNRAEIDFTPLPGRNLVLNAAPMKSARQLLGDDDKKGGEITDLPQWVRNLLLAGALLTKHSNTAAPRPRHVYVTSDLKFLVWKDPKKALHPDNKMKIFKIRSIEKGRSTPQLQRTRFGKYLAKEECSFAILGRDRTVDLEAEREIDRDKWCEALELLVAYRKAMKKVNTQFGAR